MTPTTALANYLAAHQRYHRASRIMTQAERRFRRLTRRLDDERAYELAGVSLADERSVRAYGEMQAAAVVLIEAVRGPLSAAQVVALAAFECAWGPPEPHNDR